MEELDSKAVLDALRAAITPNKKEVKPAKYVIVVDGQTLKAKPTTKSELKKAARAIKIRKPESKIEVYKYAGTLEINLPVTGVAAEEDN